MAWRPPSPTHPDQIRSHSKDLHHAERGGAHKLLPSLPSQSVPLQAKGMAAFPLPKPVQPTYIPPSTQPRLDHEDMPFRDLMQSDWPSPDLEWPQPNRPGLQNPKIHPLPFSPYPAPTMAPTAPKPVNTSPLWLEPSLEHKEARTDPFFNSRSSRPGPTSSPSGFSINRFTTLPLQQGACSYGPHTMRDNVPDTSSEETEDRTARYNLTVRQQPIKCRACGMGERDRRLIDPPPIVQLSLNDFDPSSPADVNALTTNFNVLHCALIDGFGADITQAQDPHDPKRLSRRLTGTLIANQFVGIDPAAPVSSVPNARLGCFFIFPDLSCRHTGIYRLRFTLMQLNVGIMPPGSSPNFIIQVVESDAFQVFTPKDFPGLQASSDFLRELKRQGANVTIRKGSEGRADSKGQKRGSSVSGDEPSEEGQEIAPRRRRH